MIKKPFSWKYPVFSIVIQTGVGTFVFHHGESMKEPEGSQRFEPINDGYQSLFFNRNIFQSSYKKVPEFHN
jgi:hypothetical protein